MFFIANFYMSRRQSGASVVTKIGAGHGCLDWMHVNKEKASECLKSLVSNKLGHMSNDWTLTNFIMNSQSSGLVKKWRSSTDIDWDSHISIRKSKIGVFDLFSKLLKWNQAETGSSVKINASIEEKHF